MKMFTIFALAALLMLISIGPQARADGSSGGSQSGDDLTVCCTAVYRPTLGLGSVPVIQPQVTGCTAIGSDPRSINACNGVVLGCAESAFACVTSKDGNKDCLCLQFLAPGSVN